MQDSHQQETSSEVTNVYVCVTCRHPDQPLEPKDERAGARLFAALTAHEAARDPAIRLIPVECLSVCKRPCTISFAAPGKWTYVYGDLAGDMAPETIFTGAKLYAETSDGLIPWKQRPDALKKGVVARIPPSPPVSDLS